MPFGPGTPPSHVVAAGEVGEEVERYGSAHAVFEDSGGRFAPVALQVAGGDGDLVAGGADDGVIGDPVGIWW